MLQHARAILSGIYGHGDAGGGMIDLQRLPWIAGKQGHEILAGAVVMKRGDKVRIPVRRNGVRLAACKNDVCDQRPTDQLRSLLLLSQTESAELFQEFGPLLAEYELGAVHES